MWKKADALIYDEKTIIIVTRGEKKSNPALYIIYIIMWGIYIYRYVQRSRSFGIRRNKEESMKKSRDIKNTVPTYIFIYNIHNYILLYYKLFSVNTDDKIYTVEEFQNGRHRKRRHFFFHLLIYKLLILLRPFFFFLPLLLSV